MANDYSAKRLEGLIGLGLLILTILGFLLMLVLALPKQPQVSQVAQPLSTIPRDFFSSDNAVTGQVKKLAVPSGLPVEADENSMGRDNVFNRY